MEEAEEAVQTIRRTNLVDKLGIWGWSAGGHLAAITATAVNSRLDFMILSYPVISMAEDITHIPSRKNLLGNEPHPHLVQQMSAETRVSEKTPPTFIFHTAEDRWLQDIMSEQLLGRKLDKSELELSAQRISVKNYETPR
ncbi:hypothetical protein F4778DRAFT_779543 [Xylariomycetidae sp. FL2044]|nr:hypothetical protein F4778DRAFT_779543 [Xylariomycetidae sp. FL2044]